jgi:hypothetical protein
MTTDSVLKWLHTPSVVMFISTFRDGCPIDSSTSTQVEYLSLHVFPRFVPVSIATKIYEANSLLQKICTHTHTQVHILKSKKSREFKAQECEDACVIAFMK